MTDSVTPEPPAGSQPPVVPPIPRPVAPPIPSPTAPPHYASSPPGEMQGDTTGGLIPYKNPNALLAYYIGLFSLLPVFGLAMGPAALVLGIKGLKYARQFPIVKGQIHAWVGIICGAFWTIVHYAALLLVVAMILSPHQPG